MKKAYILSLLIPFFLFLNCTKKEEVKNEVYIISKAERDYKKRLKESQNKFIPPPPPKGLFTYGSNNFIIDKDTNVFYFQQPSFFMCGTCLEDDPIPRLMEFETEDFIQIPTSSIQEFIKLNYKAGERNFTHIASQIDTLNFEVYFDLVNTVTKSSLVADKDIFIIRRTTQEEDTVIDYKKKRKSYYYENVKWDTTKIDTIRYRFVKRPE